MNLNITGRHLEITPALRVYIKNKFIKIKNHFNERIQIIVRIKRYLKQLF